MLSGGESRGLTLDINHVIYCNGFKTVAIGLITSIDMLIEVTIKRKIGMTFALNDLIQ